MTASSASSDGSKPVQPNPRSQRPRGTRGAASATRASTSSRVPCSCSSRRVSAQVGKCTCASVKPGSTQPPSRSIRRAPAGDSSSATIRSPSTTSDARDRPGRIHGADDAAVEDDRHRSASAALSWSIGGIAAGSSPRRTARYSETRSPSRTSETSRSVGVSPRAVTRSTTTAPAAACSAVSSLRSRLRGCAAGVLEEDRREAAEAAGRRPADRPRCGPSPAARWRTPAGRRSR